jgi:hypothetical protein
VLPDNSLEGILKLIDIKWVNDHRDEAYKYFVLKVLVDDKYIPLPIDMGVNPP